MTLEEMRARLKDEHDLTVGMGTLWAFLDARGLTYKMTAHAMEQDRPDVKAAREAWFEGQPDLDLARLVFLDETWTSTDMARTRGRSPRGERLRSSVPHGHWKTTTFVASLRLSGIAALFVLNGPINRRANHPLASLHPIFGRIRILPACSRQCGDQCARNPGQGQS